MALPPRVSVVIPHLNDQEGLRACLASLAAQHADGIPFEVIVVDNGSPAPPRDLCKAAGVRLEVEPTPGPGPARNRGASVAAADLIAFIDADCTADPQWLASIVHFMDHNPHVDFVGGDIRIRCTDESRMTAVEAFEAVYSYRARHYVERLGFSATGNMAVRSHVFRAVGPFGGIATMEDTEWGQRASSLGYQVAFLETARVRTPSCKSFAELIRRWDRHIAHDFAGTRIRRFGLLRWFAVAMLMAGSPLRELVTVARTDRLSDPRSRLLAFLCVTRVRLHRAWTMLKLGLKDTSRATVGTWNREGAH
ncbi:MAG: glycosyltransferase [Pararhizobium sp.]